MGYRMNSSLNNLVGASERKNNRKKTVVRATRGSEVNISQDMLKGGGKIKVVARRNSKININKPSSTASSPSKVAKSNTASTSTPIVKPAKADVVTDTTKSKTTATKPKATKPKTTTTTTTTTFLISLLISLLIILTEHQNYQQHNKIIQKLNMEASHQINLLLC